MNELAAAKDSMGDVYNRHAEWWQKRRTTSLYEKAWLDPFVSGLSQEGRILDLGCGTGRPIGSYLRQSGFNVVGVDASASMIDLAKQSQPDGDWHVADMRDLPDLGRFDGIVSWDAFFHLSPAEQRSTLPDICARIETGGSLLLTVGPGEGEAEGWINGECVYHGSLSFPEYRTLLEAHSFETIAFSPTDADMQGRSLLLATGKGAATA